MYTLLIVEDDPVISEKLQQFLSSWGYQVHRVQDFTRVMDTFRQVNPHLVLMDVTLPHLNGYAYTREIRQQSKIPILFLSSASDDSHLLMALSEGADDYLFKPFDLTVLAAKIQALLRRAYDFPLTPSYEEWQGVRFFPEEGVLRYESQEIPLTKNENRILLQLFRNKGKIVQRETLMDALWQSNVFVDDNTLSVNVNRLRRKLADCGLADFIQTRKGQGYQI